IIGRRPDHGLGRARGHRLELLQDAAELIGRMLGIEHDPGEAGGGYDLGDDIAAQAAPQPDLSPVCSERRLEAVTLHGPGGKRGAHALPRKAAMNCSDVELKPTMAS